MTLLILGVLIWSFVHAIPAVPLGMRATMIDRIGEGPWKALFVLAIVISVVLMMLGWKSLPREFIYELPNWAVHLCGLSMLVMSVLFFAPYMPNNIRRFLRHPQLVGIVLWSAGHILASGQVRSLVLFGGIGAWAVVEILLINRRDGAWERPGPVGLKSDLKVLIAGLGFFLLFAFMHEGIFGASILPAQAGFE